MNDTQTHDEQYQKLHDYLLSTNQQELAGHLDTLWQELGRLRSSHPYDVAEPKQIEAEASTTEDTEDGTSGWGYKKVA